jgi:hypothetical protein
LKEAVEMRARRLGRDPGRADDALGRKHADAALALYAPDAMLESPLVRHLLGSERGIRQGRDEPLHRAGMTPPTRQRHRTGFFSDGQRLLWEYPRVTPNGEQMDLVEVMDLRNGLISATGSTGDGSACEFSSATDIHAEDDRFAGCFAARTPRMWRSAWAEHATTSRSSSPGAASAAWPRRSAWPGRAFVCSF